ncbi:zf-TFIIB domain-containing protein [Pseudonocardia sp. CA-107938]|uniref:TFIIB-type zinc ribbon-containing protein n=1 Tax=Pseudonocardia sp. CA-107938 TaxID=3240021 RepID=UPI003D90496D
MICPKCQDRMHTVDRRGVHIEQCQRCGGIFLDRGELEQIANAEQSFYGGHGHRGGRYGDSPPPYGQQRGHYSDSPPPYGQQRGRYSDSPPPYGGHGGHKRRKGFLDELFG